MTDDASQGFGTERRDYAAGGPVGRDWAAWHTRYDQPGSPLARRLAAVQERIRIALDEAPPGEIRVLSLCAGESRDLLPVLATHPRRPDVTARLVEYTPAVAATARTTAAALDLGSVEVITGDAADLTHYTPLAPAHLVLLCGIFGNISDPDIRNTVAHAAMLTARGGTVLWTRHRGEPDLVPTIAEWFAAEGFDEVWRSGIGDDGGEDPIAFGIAAHRLEREPDPFVAGGKLFTFTR